MDYFYETSPYDQTTRLGIAEHMLHILYRDPDNAARLDAALRAALPVSRDAEAVAAYVLEKQQQDAPGVPKQRGRK